MIQHESFLSESIRWRSSVALLTIGNLECSKFTPMHIARHGGRDVTITSGNLSRESELTLYPTIKVMLLAYDKHLMASHV